eukprot:scaffold465375_cov38-Prasinocladus_malaysianus.AAC.1
MFAPNLDTLCDALSGSLPKQWSTLTELLTIDLTRSGINGSIPEGSKMHSLLAAILLPVVAAHILESIFLKGNALTGTVPASWSRMTDLYTLDFTDNVGITGTLPPAWSTLQSLMWLDAAGTEFSGTIPASWNDGMLALERLDMRRSSNKNKICYEDIDKGTKMASGVALADGC